MMTWFRKPPIILSCLVNSTWTKNNTAFMLNYQDSVIYLVQPLASLVAPMVKNPPAVQETWLRSLVWEDPLEEGTATHSRILGLENFMDSRAWRATVHAVTRVWHNWATKHSIMLKDTDFLSRWQQEPDFLPILFFFFLSFFFCVYLISYVTRQSEG